MQYRLTFLFLLLAVCAPAYLSAQYPDYGDHKNHKTSWTENDGTKVELRVRVTNDRGDDDAAIDAVQIWTDATGTVTQRTTYAGRIDCFLGEFSSYGVHLTLHPEDFPQLFKLVC